MSAYLIFMRDKTLDEHELATYSKELLATLAGHEVKVLALHGSHEDLEGASTEGAVILEFPGIEAAKAWYNGSPYREVGEHRLKGATYRVTLVEGVSSRPAQARHWVELLEQYNYTKPTVGHCLDLGVITLARDSDYELPIRSKMKLGGTVAGEICEQSSLRSISVACAKVRQDETGRGF